VRDVPPRRARGSASPGGALVGAGAFGVAVPPRRSARARAAPRFGSWSRAAVCCFVVPALAAVLLVAVGAGVVLPVVVVPGGAVTPARAVLRRRPRRSSRRRSSCSSASSPPVGLAARLAAVLAGHAPAGASPVLVAPGLGRRAPMRRRMVGQSATPAGEAGPSVGTARGRRRAR
jgi:hypothetical protein